MGNYHQSIIFGHKNAKYFTALCIFILSIAFHSSTASAQYWFENGKKVPDTESSQTVGKFGVTQLLTTDPETFLANWEKPTAGVHISTTNKVSRGQPIVSFLLFTGCETDGQHNCNLTVRFDVKKPSGGSYSKSDELDMWAYKPAPPVGKLQLGVNYIGVIIEPEDELGEYVILATVKDLNAGTELTTTQRFIASE